MTIKNIDRKLHSMEAVVLLIRPHLEGGHHENVEAGVRSGQPVLVAVLHQGERWDQGTQPLDGYTVRPRHEGQQSPLVLLAV